MPRRYYSNVAIATTLAAGIAAGDESLTLADATGYPSQRFTVRIGTEVILVGTRTGTTCSSLTRGYDGTTAAAHSAGDSVEHVVVARDMDRLWVSPVIIPYLTGRNYGPLYANRATTVLSTNRLYFVPFVVYETFSFTEILINVSAAGAAGTEIRFGLYEDVGGYPGSRLFDFGSALADTTGNKSILSSQTLEPGLYWVCVQAIVGSPTVRASSEGVIGFHRATDLAPYGAWWDDDAAYAAGLPNPAPAYAQLGIISQSPGVLFVAA